MQSHGEASSLNAAQLKNLSVGLRECPRPALVVHEAVLTSLPRSRGRVCRWPEGLRCYRRVGGAQACRSWPFSWDICSVGPCVQRSGSSADGCWFGRILSTMADEVPSVRYEAIILIEPALITREVYNANLAEREGALKAMNKAISKRRDTWNTKEEARAYFEERFPWMMWDLRVRDLFVVRRHSSMRVATSHLTLLLSPALWSTAGVRPRRQREVGREGHARVQLRTRALRILPGRGLLHRRRPHPIARPRRPHPLHPRRTGRPHVRAFPALRPHRPMLTTAPATPRRPSPEYIPQSVMGVRTPASVQKVPDAGHFVCRPQAFLCSFWC